MQKKDKEHCAPNKNVDPRELFDHEPLDEGYCRAESAQHKSHVIHTRVDRPIYPNKYAAKNIN